MSVSQQGFTLGFTVGYTMGFTMGYTMGFSMGFTVGFTIWFTIGYTKSHSTPLKDITLRQSMAIGERIFRTTSGVVINLLFERIYYKYESNLLRLLIVIKNE